MSLSPVDLENKSQSERDSFLDEVTGGEPVRVAEVSVVEATPEVPETPEKPAVEANAEPEVVAPDKKPGDALDRLAAKKKAEPAKADPTKKTEAQASAQDEEAKKAAEEKKQYKWGELKKAAEEDLPKAIADRDAAFAQRDKLNAEIADLRAAAEERDRLKEQTGELQNKLYIHDVRELPQYKENREAIDFSESQMKKAADIHKFNLTDLRDAMSIEDETERSAKVDEVLDSAMNSIGSTSRARLAGMVEETAKRKGYESYLEQNQKAALEAYRMREMQQTQAQKAKSDEIYSLAAQDAFEKLKAGVPALSDEALAKRVKSVPKIIDQPAALQAAAGYALELLPDLLEKHEEEIAGHKAHSAEKDEKIKELEGIIAKYSGAGASVKPSGDVKSKTPPRDFMEELEDLQKSGVPIS